MSRWKETLKLGKPLIEVLYEELGLPKPPPSNYLKLCSKVHKEDWESKFSVVSVLPPVVQSKINEKPKSEVIEYENDQIQRIRVHQEHQESTCVLQQPPLCEYLEVDCQSTETIRVLHRGCIESDRRLQSRSTGELEEGSGSVQCKSSECSTPSNSWDNPPLPTENSEELSLPFSEQDEWDSRGTESGSGSVPILDELNTIEWDLRDDWENLSPTDQFCIRGIIESEARTREIEAEIQELEAEIQESAARTRESEARTRESAARTRESAARTREIEARTRELRAKRLERELRTRELDSDFLELEADLLELEAELEDLPNGTTNEVNGRNASNGKRSLGLGKQWVEVAILWQDIDKEKNRLNELGACFEW